jgi:hypothetical protein
MTKEAVNHPDHYQSGNGIEVIDVIEKYSLGFHLGNAMKYLLRAGRKDPAREREDIEKARWYVKRWLDDRSPAVFGGYADRPAPNVVADAFGLAGARRIAVICILNATSSYLDDIEEALAALDEALA